MKDYERLTSGYFECSRCKNGICEIPDSLCNDRLCCERHNRLYDLENKIDRGEIDYVIEKDEEITRLKVENQRLQKEVDYWINW